MARLRAAALASVLILGAPSVALSQSATGGKIEKSVSGGGDEPRSAPRREAPARSERSGGSSDRFDGTWRSVAVSTNGCSGTSTATVNISGGKVFTNEGLSGSVSGSGSFRAVWSGRGMTGTLVGRLSGQSGSGTFKRSDGCIGSWSMAKQ